MILETLAQRYRQLYLVPGEGMEELHREVVQKGKIPENHSLAHFHTSPSDSLRVEEIPGGTVEILYLGNREDFENFLRIMLYRCKPEKIPLTIGAMTLSGVINWQKIEQHKKEFFASGGLDWSAEWKKFTSQKSNYTDVLVLISDGPYSGIPAEKVGYSEDEWLEISRKIRIYHECTHVICRRNYPEDIDAIWDEVVADAIGLLGAIGSYDTHLAALFLGVSEDGYIGGRLENYIPAEEENNMDEIAKDVYKLIHKIAREAESQKQNVPYDFISFLQEHKKMIVGDEELSAEDLDKVAGGFFVHIIRDEKDRPFE